MTLASMRTKRTSVATARVTGGATHRPRRSVTTAAMAAASARARTAIAAGEGGMTACCPGSNPIGAAVTTAHIKYAHVATTRLAIPATMDQRARPAALSQAHATSSARAG